MSSRRSQLRAAKRRQRQRDRAAGLRLYQIRLPAALRDRLKIGMRDRDFVRRLGAFLQHEMIEVDQHPNLALLCWNRDVKYITRKDAFALYERNWRLLDEASIPAHERELIDRLAEEFGHGLINA